MKKTIVTLLFVMTSAFLLAQISNSRWKGTLRGDNPQNVIFDFKKDTAVVYTLSDSSIVETMTYSVKDLVLTLHKIDGISDCDNSTPGKYRIRIVNDVLYLTLLDDDCADRSSAIDSIKWVKWKNRPEVAVSNAILQQYTGEYELDAAHHIFITLENGRLHAYGPNNNLPKSPMYAQSNTTFFLKVAGVEIDFVKNAKGEVVKFISHEEKDHELKKIK
ncbi:DUF3471 domain-containing protein [Flavitalea sp.]|nr:DUF3471 domain-containing protein [Flavitalea sp.]